jgi:small subunit ribosomal protein S20
VLLLAIKNKSAIKAHRQSEERRLRNKIAKSRVRTCAKIFVEAVQAKDKTLANEKFRAFVKTIDTVSRKGIIKKATAARKKSRLNKLLNSMSPT